MVIIMDCLQTPYKLKPPTLNKQQLKKLLFDNILINDDDQWFYSRRKLESFQRNTEPVQDIPLFFSCEKWVLWIDNKRPYEGK